MIDSFGDVAPGYLDWARFGPLSPAVRAEMHADAEMLGTGRPSGIDLVSDRTAEARELLGRLMELPADEIVLQPSTTHGLSHALFGLAGTVLVPAQEFPAVRVAAGRAAEARGVLTVREIDPPDGIVRVENVAAALTDDVTAVALSLVDFRTGALVDLAGLREAIGDRLLIVDAIQAFGVVDVDWGLADVVVGNGYKWLRAGRGTGFARFSPRARERIVPVLSGISGMVGDAGTLGLPAPREGAAAYSVAPSDPLAASRLAASLRELLDVGVADVAAHVRDRARDVISLADAFGVPVLTPRDAHAGIVALLPDPADAAALAAAFANHGVTVTARGSSIRVSTHLGSGSASIDLLGGALADAAARRVVAIDFSAERGPDPSASEVFTIEIPEEDALLARPSDATDDGTPEQSDEAVAFDGHIAQVEIAASDTAEVVIATVEDDTDPYASDASSGADVPLIVHSDGESDADVSGDDEHRESVQI